MNTPSLARRALRLATHAFATLAATAGILAATQAHAQTDPLFRIGWQKGGSLAVIKARGNLDAELATKGVKVNWIEFTAGPQMLEALNVGSIDFGLVGETPPVFAQAAGADLLYVGVEPPAPKAEKVLVPKDSPIQSVKDLKGKRIALNKGSNVHYLLVKLLENAGLQYSDVTVAFLPPADARAAFESGRVDAWAIWEPFAAAAESQIGARILADGTGVVNNHIFFIASRPFTERNPGTINTALRIINSEGQWITTNIKAAAEIVAPQIGLPQEIAELAVSRYVYGAVTVSDEVARQQQEIADVFAELKLIPRKLDVASVVWQAKKP